MADNPQTGSSSVNIAIVGWYKRRNFGDDLMAVLYAVRLKRDGAAVKVWGLDVASNSEFGIEVEDDLSELLKWCDVIVYGGGGLFTNAHRRIAAQDGFNTDMEMVCLEAQRRNMPLILSSVGGDGADTILDETQRLLLTTASLVTLRNEEDTVWLGSNNWEPEIYADVVWRAASDLGVVPKEEKLMLVHFLNRLDLWALRLLTAPKNLTGTSHLLNIDAEHYSRPKNDQHRIEYSSVAKTMSTLSRAQVLFTHRLHMAIFLMSLGRVVIPINPEAKSRLVFARLNGEHLILDSNSSLWARLLVLAKAAWSSEKLLLPRADIQENIASAEGHFRAIARFLDKLKTTKESSL